MVPKTRDSHFRGHSKRIIVPKKRGTLILRGIYINETGQAFQNALPNLFGKKDGEIDRFNGDMVVFGCFLEGKFLTSQSWAIKI